MDLSLIFDFLGSPWVFLFLLPLVGYTCWKNPYEFNTFAQCVANIGGNEQMRVGINDGVDTTWGSCYSGTTFTQVSCTKTLSASATRLRFYIWAAGMAGGSHGYADTCAISIPSSYGLSSCVKLIEFEGDIVGASGSNLVSLSEANFTRIADFGARITDLCVYQNRLYIAQGWDNAFSMARYYVLIL